MIQVRDSIFFLLQAVVRRCFTVFVRRSYKFRKIYRKTLVRENTFFIEHLLQYNIRLENKIFLSLGKILCKYFYSALAINSSSAQWWGGGTIEIKFFILSQGTITTACDFTNDPVSKISQTVQVRSFKYISFFISFFIMNLKLLQVSLPVYKS